MATSRSRPLSKVLLWERIVVRCLLDEVNSAASLLDVVTATRRLT